MDKVGVADGVSAVVDRLRAEHAQLDARLHELEHHVSLTPEEHLEVARLKKMKLLTKDRIAILNRRGHA
jgi:hypothetical protein